MTKFLKAFFLILGIISSFDGYACSLEEGHDCTDERLTFVSTKTSSGKWKDEDVPKDEWKCYEIEDIGSASQRCQMCEREMIRYVHKMAHSEYQDLEVGCICAGHMEGDTDVSKSREGYFRARSSRRQSWLGLEWKLSKKGNQYITTRRNKFDQNNHRIVICKSRYNKFCPRIDNESMDQWFKTPEEAQYAAFDSLWPASLSFDNQGG